MAGSAPLTEPKRSRRARGLEWIVIIVVATVVALGVRAYVAQDFVVPSTSMWPTLQVGDRILVNKLAYDLHGIHRGDIVVFRRPPNEHCPPPEVAYLVKRVIGLSGETLSSRGNHVYVNGRLLHEPWLPSSGADLGTPIPTTTVPKGDIFVMGDNRVFSCDSRIWGPFPQGYVVGHVVLRIWPPSRIGLPG